MNPRAARLQFAKADLLACPFCGPQANDARRPYLRHGINDEYRVAVQCPICSTITAAYGKAHQAIREWNKRYEPPKATECTPIPAADESGWCEWQYPIMRDYRMACCDCGLVHEVEFAALKVTENLPDGEWAAESLDIAEYRVGMRMRREAKPRT